MFLTITSLPHRLQDTTPRKRISLSLRLPASTSPSAYATTLPVFTYFLRLADTLAETAHFRPDINRKLRTTREDEIKKLRRMEDEQKSEERKLEADKRKKVERDARLKGLSAEEQRKYLDREREKDKRKGQRRIKTG